MLVRARPQVQEVLRDGGRGSARRGDPALADPRTGAYELEITLVGAHPRVWRRLRIAGAASFRDLHRAIQHACGWTSPHLFAFSDPTGETVAGVPFDDGFGEPDPDAAEVATGGADPDDLADWLGDWEPEAFDLEAVRSRFDR